MKDDSTLVFDVDSVTTGKVHEASDSLLDDTLILKANGVCYNLGKMEKDIVLRIIAPGTSISMEEPVYLSRATARIIGSWLMEAADHMPRGGT
jgi:hypothetical protein